MHISHIESVTKHLESVHHCYFPATLPLSSSGLLTYLSTHHPSATIWIIFWYVDIPRWSCSQASWCIERLKICADKINLLALSEEDLHPPRPPAIDKLLLLAALRSFLDLTSEPNVQVDIKQTDAADKSSSNLKMVPFEAQHLPTQTINWQHSSQQMPQTPWMQNHPGNPNNQGRLPLMLPIQMQIGLKHRMSLPEKEPTTEAPLIFRVISCGSQSAWEKEYQGMDSTRTPP